MPSSETKFLTHYEFSKHSQKAHWGAIGKALHTAETFERVVQQLLARKHISLSMRHLHKGFAVLRRALSKKLLEHNGGALARLYLQAYLLYARQFVRFHY